MKLATEWFKLIHVNCGGEIADDLTSPPYHYNSETGTSNPEDPEIPVLRCKKCQEEIIGDAQIVDPFEELCRFTKS